MLCSEEELTLVARVSPSIYAVFESISANDGCAQVGQTYAGLTASFAPGELSTIDDGTGATQVYDFKDLPCPPTGVFLQPGEEYKPRIAAPQWLLNLDPAFSTCIAGRSQGVDPPTWVPVATGLDGPWRRAVHPAMRTPPPNRP